MSNIVYLLGSGFSSAITEGRAPLTKELGEKLKDVFPEELQQRFDFDSNNIELFFTKLDLEIMRLRQAGQEFNRLEEIRNKASCKIVELLTTKKLFSIENGKVKIPECAKKICEVLFRKNDTILTVNYDCALENILSIQNKWSTFGGWWKNFCFEGDTENRDKKLNIEILKVHGSINFVLVAPLGRNSDNELQLKWRVDKEIFPNGHEYTSWHDGRIEGHIVLPSYLKQFEYPEIVDLWKEAVVRIQRTNKIVIIGCALREEDYSLKFLLSLANSDASLIIIDPSADEIKKKLINVASDRRIYTENIKIECITDDIVKKIYNAQ